MDLALLSSWLQSTVTMAVPLLLAALGEVICERAGVLNIGLEGLMLSGALAATVAAQASGSPELGVLAAVWSGLVLSGLFGVLVVYRGADQVVVGVALNLLALGLTGVLNRAVFGVSGSALTVPSLTPIAIPGLATLPVIGQALFQQSLLGYFAFAVVPAAWWGLQRSLPGLRLRMVGENPLAAAVQGVHVQRAQLIAILLCGALAAAGGAFLVVAYTHTFVEGMSAGRGFIALGIVIFGRWSPWGVLAAALLFGAATALQFYFQAQASIVPYQFLLMLPYLMTLVVLSTSRARAQAPAALGVPLTQALGRS